MVLFDKYAAMYQGPQLDAFGRVSTKLSPPVIDSLEKIAILQDGSVSVQVENHMNPKISVGFHKIST